MYQLLLDNDGIVGKYKSLEMQVFAPSRAPMNSKRPRELPAFISCVYNHRRSPLKDDKLETHIFISLLPDQVYVRSHFFHQLLEQPVSENIKVFLSAGSACITENMTVIVPINEN